MNGIWIFSLSFASLLAVSLANPAGIISTAGHGVVEIEKQKLVKFPDDIDQQQRQQDPSLNKEKVDEAKRILEEIEKINQSLGYVKKKPDTPKIPSILDTSQYLFPKPALQPFHAQNHQVAGENGEILLVPSIRAVKFDRSSKRTPQLINFNIPPQRQTIGKSSLPITSSNQTTIIPKLKVNKTKTQFYFRPSEVHIPAPQSLGEQQQLPTHFVIPVRLYKMNKEEYMQRFAPQEYRVKGYKIVGDIDNFYGKAKAKAPAKHKKKSTPKYHLFFLPREMILNEDSTFKQKNEGEDNSIQDESQQADTGSREEKLTNRPFKVQSTASASNSAGHTNTTTSTQIIRKRIVPKPIRNKETNINSMATQQLDDGISATTTTTTVHITPPSPPMAQTSQTATVQLPSQPNQSLFSSQADQLNSNSNNGNSNKNSYNRPLLSSFLNPNNNNNNNNYNNNQNIPNNLNLNDAKNATANAIKTAFQNFFKLPFRQETKPNVGPTTTNTESGGGGGGGGGSNLQSVPLQAPHKTFFGVQSFLPQPFYQSESVSLPIAPPAAHSSNPRPDPDYRWDDENSNSDGEEADEEDNNEEEKKIFGHRHEQQQETQKEAIKQGGIIIQRLKVRKGGIAIAGPGGVATAGSGGTAIVGPGGYALTHPRSLTIAGPGAKVIAIPANVDLKDALQRTNLHSLSFPREGKIVATGPTVYYSPATGTATDEEDQQ